MKESEGREKNAALLWHEPGRNDHIRKAMSCELEKAASHQRSKGHFVPFPRELGSQIWPGP